MKEEFLEKFLFQSLEEISGDSQMFLKMSIVNRIKRAEFFLYQITIGTVPENAIEAFQRTIKHDLSRARKLLEKLD